MRLTLAAFLAFPILALASISVTTPNSSDYWVQNGTKTITWTYTSGDPSPVSIVILNKDDTFLNGDFSIDEYVNLSLESFTITNVTLKTGSGYQVAFVNPTNQSDVYATSNTFEVKSAGTAPAPSSTGIGISSSSGTSSGPSSSSGTSTATGSQPSGTGNGALRTESILYTLAACGFASFGSLMF